MEEPEDLRYRIAGRLRATRHDRRLTIEQVCAYVRITPGHLSMIERGLREPSLHIFMAICNALNCYAGDILEDRE